MTWKAHRPLIQAVYAHHERWDGQGYPERLHGAEIPKLGRVVAVADALAAMTRERSWARSKTLAEAITQVVRGSGTQFDPDGVWWVHAVGSGGRT